MNRSMNISAVRVVREVMTDSSNVYGVDLFDKIGDDLGEEYVHVPCKDVICARRLSESFVSNSSYCELMEDIVRDHC